MHTIGSAPANTRRLYWWSVGLLSLIFLFSAFYGVLDLQGSYAEYRHLEFPAWLVFPLSLAKLLGVVAVVSNRSTTLKDFAFAGFLYDLLLALGAHIAQQELKVVLPLISLGIWAAAFVMDRRVYPRLDRAR